MVFTRAISPNYQPAHKDAGFHFVQALLLLTRHLSLKETFVPWFSPFALQLA